jgi:hypothetical protein
MEQNVEQQNEVPMISKAEAIEGLQKGFSTIYSASDMIALLKRIKQDDPLELLKEDEDLRSKLSEKLQHHIEAEIERRASGRNSRNGRSEIVDYDSVEFEIDGENRVLLCNVDIDFDLINGIISDVIDGVFNGTLG